MKLTIPSSRFDRNKDSAGLRYCNSVTAAEQPGDQFRLGLGTISTRTTKVFFPFGQELEMMPTESMGAWHGL